MFSLLHSVLALILISSSAIQCGTLKARADLPAGIPSCPLKDDPATSGDADSFDAPDPPPADLCKRGASCSSMKNPDQVSIPGMNKQQLYDDWIGAQRTGRALKNSMDNYVSRRASRLDSTPEGAKQLTNFQTNYRLTGQDTGDVDAWVYNNPGVAQAWSETDYPQQNWNEGFTVKKVFAENPRTGKFGLQVTLDVAGNPDTSILVSLHSFAACDVNESADRSYSSTLAWQSWKAIAGDRARKLKYQVRASVGNRLSQNIMMLAHELYPQNVQDRVPGSSFAGRNPSRLGHGIWTPEDEAFPTLLAMPNVKTVVNMILDYNPEMDNPYIVKIHTWPRRGSAELARPSDRREAYIVIEFGQFPTLPDSGHLFAGTVATS